MAKANSWFWLHLNLTDQRCARWLERNLAMAPQLAAEFSSPNLRQRLTDNGQLLCGHLADFRQEFDASTSDSATMHILMCARFLITGRLKALQSAERLRKDLKAGMVFAGPAELLSHAVANYPDTLDVAHYVLMDELETVEDQVLDERQRGERRRLMLARREMAKLHRHMRSLRRALVHAERTQANFPAGLRTVVVRLTHLDQDFEVMESRARFFHDEIDAKLAAETNRQLYILSALTAAFLPPTLVAGLFGMNFPGIPFVETSAGFYIAIGLGILSSAAVWLFLWLVSKR